MGRTLTPAASARRNLGRAGAMIASRSRSSFDAAIVVVNYAAELLVARCLRSVREASEGLDLELIVVDNASPGGEAERLRANLPAARVVAMSENAGFAAGVNAGFDQTTAELVVVLNPDTEVRAGALAALVRHLREHADAGVVAPLIEDARGRLAPNGYRRFPSLLTATIDLCVPIAYALELARAPHPYAMSPNALRAGGRVKHVCGAAMAIRRSAYDDAGPLDERFFLYFEETEWQRRVAERGWSIEIEPQARVCHLVRGGGEQSLAPSPYFVTSALRYLRAEGVSPALCRVAFAAALLSSWLTLSAIALLPGKRRRARQGARAYAALLEQLR